MFQHIMISIVNKFIHNGGEWMGGRLKGKGGQKGEEITKGLVTVRKFENYGHWAWMMIIGLYGRRTSTGERLHN